MILAQLSELEQKHQHLEKEIAEAITHCSMDHLEIAGLKRQKLRVKEQIEYLRHH